MELRTRSYYDFHKSNLKEALKTYFRLVSPLIKCTEILESLQNKYIVGCKKKEK